MNDHHDTQAESAERGLLACALNDPATSLQATPDVFAYWQHQELWTALRVLHDAGQAPDATTLAPHVRDITGTMRIVVDLMGTALPQNVPAYLDVLRDRAERRRLSDLATGLHQRANNLQTPVSDATEWAAEQIGKTGPARETSDPRHLFRPGGSFILDQSDVPPAWWGRGAEILGAEGEALTIAGGPGVGKTTLAGQLALGRAGFHEYSTLLGFPILPGRRRVLYLAMDRPRQAARSLRRMVGEAWRAELDDRLSIWPGPPPYDMAKTPGILLRLCQEADADTVIIDSLKDAAVGISDDEVGAGFNRARQGALATGVEVIELHHNRKASNGVKRDKLTLDDLYGSTWIPAGAGSVLILSGEPGDPIVGMHHVKQPMDEVGPLKISHDAATGRSTIWHSADLLGLAKAQGTITAVDAATALFDTDKPTPTEREKARRALNRLTGQGLLEVAETGDKTRQTPTTWRAA